MEIYEKFKAYAEKSRLTAEEKKEIEEAAESYGITLNKKCGSCYKDAAIQIALANKPERKQEAGEYELCDGIDITLSSFRFGSLRICKAACNTENAKKWIAAGVPLRFFKRVPADEGNE